jgi:hypothetical protein
MKTKNNEACKIPNKIYVALLYVEYRVILLYVAGDALGDGKNTSCRSSMGYVHI